MMDNLNDLREKISDEEWAECSRKFEELKNKDSIDHLTEEINNQKPVEESKIEETIDYATEETNSPKPVEESKIEETMDCATEEAHNPQPFQEQHFMIYNIVTGVIKGYYITGIWELENILKEVNEGEALKEITKDIWNSLIGNNEEIKINSPKLKEEMIEQFNNATLLDIDLVTYMETYFEETVYEPVPYEPTQQEKDIKFLAETLNSIIEPMQLPEDGKPNPFLENIQNIINRYNQ